jgi:AmiR/NasT family two-component response regulator
MTANGIGSSFDGLRVIIAEDELVLSLDLEDMITQMGCVIVGNATRVSRALELASDTACDVAVLDVNLNGESIDEAADILIARGVPVVFTTGYSPKAMASRHGTCPVVSKPYSHKTLAAGIRSALEKVRA